MKIGPTGKFPDGKLGPKDEGELVIGIADDDHGNIVINFGKPVYWLALPKEKAIEFGMTLISKAGGKITQLR